MKHFLLFVISFSLSLSSIMAQDLLVFPEPGAQLSAKIESTLAAQGMEIFPPQQQSQETGVRQDGGGGSTQIPEQVICALGEQ